jgi:hypothetical protein
LSLPGILIVADHNGHYRVEVAPEGPFDLTIKACSWLRKKWPSVAFPSGVTEININGTLMGGDLNGDNRVNAFDLAILKKNWNAVGAP